MDINCLPWIEKYLKGHKTWTATTINVPYLVRKSVHRSTSGTLLGPALFNSIINDLEKKVNSTIIKLTDDTKLEGVANTNEDTDIIV